MKLVQIHRCLGDETRLRILHLLTRGPLCVCHFQEVLRLPQVAVSKHLAYLRENGLVTATRKGADDLPASRRGTRRTRPPNEVPPGLRPDGSPLSSGCEAARKPLLRRSAQRGRGVARPATRQTEIAHTP